MSFLESIYVDGIMHGEAWKDIEVDQLQEFMIR
jgi:hypothetical protein